MVNGMVYILGVCGVYIRCVVYILVYIRCVWCIY